MYGQDPNSFAYQYRSALHPGRFGVVSQAETMAAQGTHRHMLNSQQSAYAQQQARDANREAFERNLMSREQNMRAQAQQRAFQMGMDETKQKYGALRGLFKDSSSVRF